MYIDIFHTESSNDFFLLDHVLILYGYTFNWLVGHFQYQASFLARQAISDNVAYLFS